MKGQPHRSISYTYAVSPFTEKPVQIDWKIIVNNDDIECQHIRCHALQPGDSIKELVSTFKKALAKAVVLINTQDNYTLSPELTEGMEQGGFPVVILTKCDGQSLAEFLEKHYGQDVHAKLDIINTIKLIDMDVALLEQLEAASLVDYETDVHMILQEQLEAASSEDCRTEAKAIPTRTGYEMTGDLLLY